MPTVVAFAPDLLDQSRIAAAATAGGRRLVLARTAAEIPQHLEDISTLVLADLSRPGVLQVLPALGSSRCVGFAPHIDGELMRRARAAGCAQVFARSAFFARLPELLGELADDGTPQDRPPAAG